MCCSDRLNSPHKADLVLQWLGMEHVVVVEQPETGSDISFARLRHTCRPDRATATFVMARVEFQPHIGTKYAWTTIWDAP